MGNDFPVACLYDFVAYISTRYVEGIKVRREIIVEFKVYHVIDGHVTPFNYLIKRYCFVEKMRRSGVLEPAMAHVLNDWYDQNTQDHRALPHVIGIINFSLSTLNIILA